MLKVKWMFGMPVISICVCVCVVWCAPFNTHTPTHSHYYYENVWKVFGLVSSVRRPSNRPSIVVSIIVVVLVVRAQASTNTQESPE